MDREVETESYFRQVEKRPTLVFKQDIPTVKHEKSKVKKRSRNHLSLHLKHMTAVFRVSWYTSDQLYTTPTTVYNEYYQECNRNKKKIKKECSGIILAYPNFVLIYMQTQKNQLFSSATSFWLWCNQCLDENKPLFLSENAMCNEMTTIRLFSTMFQARGRSISTGPWDICGTSVEIDHWWMIVNDFVYVSCSLIQTCASLPV